MFELAYLCTPQVYPTALLRKVSVDAPKQTTGKTEIGVKKDREIEMQTFSNSSNAPGLTDQGKSVFRSIQEKDGN